MKTIHRDPEVPEKRHIEHDLQEIEKEFYKDLLHGILEHISRFLLYGALLGLGAWLAFYYLRCYAEREEERHG